MSLFALGRPHLVLVLDAGMSLAIWNRYGILERELSLYRSLRPHLSAFTLVSHGGPEEAEFASRLPDGRLVCNQRSLSRRLYQWRVAFGLGLMLRLSPRPAVVKTNQMPGAGFPLRIVRVSGARFLLRTGYQHLDACQRLFGVGSCEAEDARKLERLAYGHADLAQVTSPDSKREVMEAYGLDETQVRVVPNFVDTDLFAPRLRQERTGRPLIVMIGRLADQKNYPAAIEALSGLDVELVIVGDGSLLEALQELAAHHGVKTSFLGRRVHESLPGILTNADLYLQTSRFEGHPKSLVEAMSCALPVIATDSPGISGLILPGETGLLCSQDPASIRSKVQELLDDRQAAAAMGGRARQWVEANCSLERVAQIELSILNKLAS